MVVPMLAVRGKLELSTSTLSFTISPEFEAEFKQQIEKQAAYIANAKRFEGVNKFLMLTLPENKIWKLGELTHEEFRLYLFRQTAVELFFQDGSSSFFSSSFLRFSFFSSRRFLRSSSLRFSFSMSFGCSTHFARPVSFGFTSMSLSLELLSLAKLSLEYEYSLSVSESE